MADVASVLATLEQEREAHRQTKRAAKLAADQASGLKRALDDEAKLREAAEARASAFEVALFEERSRSTQALRRLREECVADAADVAVALVRDAWAAGGAAGPRAAAASAAGSAGAASSAATASDPVAATAAMAAGRASLGEAFERAQSVGVGVLFKARQLRSHHGGALQADGSLLKETVLAVAHGYGTAPPLSPAEALPAALACVDFAVVALPALLDKAAAPAGGEAPSGLRSIGAAGMSLLKEVVFAADDDGRDDDRPQPSLQLAVSGVVEEDDGTSV